MLDIPSNDILNPFSSNWDSFGAVFGWGLENDIDFDVGLQNSMFDGNDLGPVSSTEHLSAAWLLCATPRGGSPVEGIKENERKRDPFGRNHDNPWVSPERYPSYLCESTDESGVAKHLPPKSTGQTPDSRWRQSLPSTRSRTHRSRSSFRDDSQRHAIPHLPVPPKSLAHA